MSCLISFVRSQPTCQERVESDRIQTEKFLPTVGLEPKTLRFVAPFSTDWAYRALMKAVFLKWPLNIHVLPITMYTLVWVREWLSRAHFVLYMYCFVLQIGIYLYWTNIIAKRRTSPVFAFNMHDQTYALLHNSRTYTYILGSTCTCMFKGNFNRTAFIKARLPQSVDHRSTNLKVVDSSPTVGKNFSFCILMLLTHSWQVDWSHTNEIKHDIQVHRENDYLKEKMAAVLVPRILLFKFVRASFKKCYRIMPNAIFCFQYKLQPHKFNIHNSNLTFTSEWTFLCINYIELTFLICINII